MVGLKGKSIDEILQNMFYSRGFELRNCNMSNLQRRVSQRMDVLEIPSLTEYLEYLEANEDEYEALFNAILVNTSQFFRNPEAWDFVKEDILPNILGSGDEIKIWSAGCASGEEPYSVAIMLAEMLGDDLTKRIIRIHATDIDEAALRFARSGTYTLNQLVGLPKDLRGKYFSRRGDIYTIGSNIRSLVIFSRHNLVSYPPISRIDLLLCRNVLIYFNQALQSRIIPKLQYALGDKGYLWLGEAETLVPGVRRLKPLNAKWRIFKKIPYSAYSQPVRVSRFVNHREMGNASASRKCKQAAENVRAGFVALDKDFNVAMCNQTIQDIWGVMLEQILGKSFFDLKISHCPVEMRYRLEQAVATGELSVLEDIEYWITKDERIYLKMEIIPMTSSVIILIEDTTKQYELRKEMQIANKALETENERLFSVNQELACANRLFQSINEELQSANEELESMNEELRTTSAELMIRLKELNMVARHHEVALSGVGFSIKDGEL